MVVWLVVCGFRSLNVGGLDSGGLDSGGRKEMESYLLGRNPRTKPHQAAGEEEWKATSSGEALEQSQFKLQAKGNGKLLPRAEPSHKAIPSCKQPRCGGLPMTRSSKTLITDVLKRVPMTEVSTRTSLDSHPH